MGWEKNTNYIVKLHKLCYVYKRKWVMHFARCCFYRSLAAKPPGDARGPASRARSDAVHAARWSGVGGSGVS